MCLCNIYKLFLPKFLQIHCLNVYNFNLKDKYKRLNAPLPIDASVEHLNDAYFKTVKTIELQAPKKKKPSKAVFGVGDAAQHYYAVFVMLQSQRSSSGPNS